MRIKAIAGGIDRQLGKAFDPVHLLEGEDVIITAPDGVPLVEYEGEICGPLDVPGVTIVINARHATQAEVDQIRGAGWNVKVVQWCSWCGNEMKPWSGDKHPECEEV